MSKEKATLNYLTPLYNFCVFLGMVPPHRFGAQTTPISLRFKFYTIFHIFLCVTLYVHSYYGREHIVYPSMDRTVALTDKIANFMLTFFNVLVRVLMVFYSGTTMKQFLNRAYDLSVQDMFEGCSRRTFKIHFIAFNIFMAFLLLFDGFLWINTVGLKLFQYYFGRSLTYYMCNVAIFLMFHSVLPIKHYFASLGPTLDTIAKNLFADDADERKEYVLSEFQSKSVPERTYTCHDLRKIRKNYNNVCELVDYFNRIYGLIIVFVIIVVISYVLNLTDLLLVYGLSKGKKLDGVQYGTDLIVVCGLWMLTLLMFTILMAYGCAGAVAQAETISKMAYFWMNELPTLPGNNKEQYIKEELAILIQQATTRCPKFSAAGFFPVDFTLLGFIFGTVTSYIIISIQFIDH